MVFQYEAVNRQLVVGRPADNIVTLFILGGLPESFFKSSPANGLAGFPTNPTLSWGGSSGATSYEFCYDDTNDSICNGVWINTDLVTHASLSGLKRDTTYFWQVRARNTDGLTYANGDIWWSFTTAKYFLYQPLVFR